MGIDHSNPYIHSTTVLCDEVTDVIIVTCHYPLSCCIIIILHGRIKDTARALYCIIAFATIIYVHYNKPSYEY